MRFKRIIALLLVFAMVIPTGLIHAADLVLKEDANIVKQMPSGLTELEGIIDVTDEPYEAEIIVTSAYGILAYSPQSVQLSIVEENPVGKRIVGNKLLIDQGAPAGTITIKAVLPDNFYTIHTMTVNSGGGSPQPAQPRIAHTLLDTSDLNHLIVSATALDGGIHNVQIRTFYKNASGMVGGDISNLTREGNSSVFSADITDQVSSKMRDSNAYEMTYFFTMSNEDEEFLQYPEVIDMNSLEGALTVKLADPPDLSTAAIVEHTPPVVTSFDNIPATFKITQLQEGEVPTINVYYRSELNSNSLSIVKGMGQLTHVDGDTYTVNLADPEFKQLKAHTIEYFISTNRGNQWVYYPQGMNPSALTGLYSTSIPRELYGSEEPEEPEIKKADLESKIFEASDLWFNSIEGNGVGEYSRQARDALLDALMQAEDVYYFSENQMQINNAYQMLSDAIEIFRAAAVTPLQAIINDAQWQYDYYPIGSDFDQYPAEAKNALGAAITSAKEWNNPTSTEAELDAAYQALDAAITKFLDSIIKRGDPSVLQEKIDEIHNILIFTSEGDGPGQYPYSAYRDLDSVIDAANVLIRNSGTEAQINEAYENLVNALQVFKDSKNPDTNKVALQAGIETARAFLDASEVGTKVGQYPADSKDILQGSIDAAWETLINLMSTQVEVDQALTSVNDALADFKASVLVQGDQLFLHVTIIDAKELLDNSPVGEGAGQFPSDAMHALEAAIGVAETAISGPMTQVELDEARQALETAVTTFKAAEIKAVDKTALQGKIDDATSAYNMSRVGTDFGEYPAEAKTALKAAIDAAKVLIDKSAASQAEIDAATQTLNAAITTFYAAAVEMGDYLKLQEKVIEARSLYRESPRGDGIGAYPDAAFNDFDEAIELANEIATYLASQTKLDKALQALSDAMEKFEESVIKAGDNTALQAAITEAKILLEGSTEGNGVGEYPLEAMDLLASAITDAENLANEEATQVAMDEAILTLNNAVAAFEAAVIKEGNSTELQLKIEAARNLLSFSAEGDRPGEYPSEAFDALDKAVEAAETLMDSPGTQQQIDDAHHDLVQAIEAFENAKIQEGEYAPLLIALSEAMTLYDTSSEGYGAGQYWPEVKELFMTAIEAANIVAGGPSTQEEIEEALQTLADAVEDFQKSVVRAGDSTNLQLAITDLTTLLSNSKEGDDAGEYPAGSKAILQAAVTAASNVISEPATQQEIDQAYEELIDAAGIFIAKIIPAGNISKALEKIYEVGRLLEASKAGTGVGQYPAEAIAALEAVFDAAIIVIDKPSSQVKLDATYQALVDAVDVFKKAQIQAGDTEEADAVVTGAETLLRDSIVGEGVGEYPLAAKTTLEAAIAAAKEVFEQPATQAQIDEAKATLEAAITAFVAKVNGAGSSEEADAVVIGAETLLKDSVVGEGVGEYPLAAKTTLEAAIAAAKELLEHPATQVQIDTAKATLEAAIKTFEAAVNKEGSSEEAGTAVIEAEALLKDSVVGEGVGEYPQAAKTTLEAAIAAAKEVFEQPATQEQIDTAKTTLEAAIKAFEAAVNKEGSSEEADAAMTGAETLLRDSIVGEGVGEYPLAAKTILEAAIAAAKEVFENPATQAQIDEAKATLEAAISTFEAEVNKEGSSEEADAAVTEAEALLVDVPVGEGVGQYPSEAVDVLKAAIKAAKEVFENPATQAQIDEAKATLEAAITAFEAAVNKEGSSEEVDAAVTEAEALLVEVPVGEGVGQYPSEAVDVLKAAIKAAKEVFEHPATQAQIDEAKATLEAAITTFEAAVNKEGSSEEADAAVTEAEALLVDVPVGDGVGQYPSEAVDVLKAAIKAAKEVFEHPATQAQIDEAKATLEAAITAFEAAVNKEGSSEEADAAVTEAEALLVDVPVGEGVGQYPSEAVDVLKAAIKAAKEVFEHPATQAQIDEAKATLEAAITTFEAAVNKEGSSEEADAAVTEAETLLVDVPVGEGVGQYPSEAVDVLKAAIKAAKEVFEHPATQAQIDEAKATLEAAITTFEATVNKEGSSEEADAAVTEAEALLVDVPVGEGVGQYPSEAVDVLKAAIKAAKEVFEHPATQAQIDEAKATLEAAITAFEAAVNKEGSSEEADAAVTEAEALLVDVPVGEGVGQYPSEAVDVLKAAIKAAKEVFEHPATQAQIDEAKATLEAAITTFEAAVNKEGSSEAADAAVTEAEALLVDVPVGEGVGQYPSEAVDVLKAAIKAAKEVFENPATQAQIDEAKATLEAAISTFEAAVNTKGDSEEADVAVTGAETLLKNSVVGEGVGQYPSEAVDVLKAAIKAAKEVFDHPATQAQIDEAKATLEEAITTFKNAVNKEGSSEESDTAVTEAEALLVDVPVGEGVGQYPSEAVDVLKAAIKAVKEVFEHPATQAQIDEAKATLEAAITAFEAAVNKEGNSEEADAAVTEAETLLVDVPVGEGVGQYPAEAVDVLKAAIQAAKEVFDHPATQAQIDAVKATLEAAVAAFEAAVIKAGNAGEIQAQITEATTLLNESTEGNGVGQYPAGSKAILQAAITAAENVIRTAATQAEIDKANEQLTAAYNTFRAAVIKTAPVDSYTPPVSNYTPPAATQPVTQPSTKITDGLNTVETGQGTVKTAASEVQEIMKAAKPVILESTLGVIDFGKNGLNVPELKLGLGTSLELGILMTEKSKTDEVLAGAKLDQAGMQPLGGKVLDLIAQLNYSNGTSTRIKSFAEPVKVTINLKELGLTGDTTNLTAVRFVPQADGTYKTIKLGGIYIPATNSFEFYTDSFSLYSIVKADSVTKITFKVDSKEYSIGTLAKQNDVPPVIQEQRTLVPIRAVAEAMGAEVKWDHATKTATITLDGKVLTMTLGELIEGMDVPAQAIDGRIMVPLRYVSEALGAYVMWFPQDKRIEIIR